MHSRVPCLQGSLKSYSVGDTLLAKLELRNLHDPYAVVVVTLNDTIVDHLPWNRGATCKIN